jgi:mono/diheme cytochrome c family protein
MCLLGGLVTAAAFAATGSRESVDFIRDIRPILSEHCFSCHGPDEATRESGLRFDQREGALQAAKSGLHAIVPGHPDQSEALLRLTDELDPMPPVETGKRLTSAQQAQFRAWIAAGAPYEQHWSLQAPAANDPPAVRDRTWPTNPIDAFILSRLEAEGLAPAQPADPATLLRRVSFDLTGLPPSPTELAAFLADSRPDAYQRAVDRLLASPTFGERMAVDWLDAARYADSNGFFRDNTRQIWLWRDWVIAAFNRNQPFDAFTIEQIAGDLLPHPTLEQRIATGFNRNHMVTGETGVIDEEYRVEYVADRLETTGNLWLGLTLGCARCHDHKYDPISQREYYQLFAFFNTGVEKGLVNPDDPPPVLEVPTPRQRSALSEAASRARKAEAELQQSLKPDAERLDQWEVSLRTEGPGPRRESSAHDAAEATLDGAEEPTRYPRLVGPRRHEGGVVGQALALDGPQHLEFSPDLPIRADRPWTIGFWLNPGAPSIGILRKRTQDRGLDVHWSRGRLEVSLRHSSSQDALRLRSAAVLKRAEWSHLVLAYDGTSRAAGLRLFVDGRVIPVEVLQDALSGTAESAGSLDFGVSGKGERFYGLIDEIYVLPDTLSAEDVRSWYWSERLVGVLRVAADQRDSWQRDVMQRGFVEMVGTPQQHEHLEQLERARTDLATLRAQVPRTLVMQDSSPQRATHVLRRGAYDQPAEPVQPGVPAVLPSLPPGAPLNRLTLARWLVRPDHPLTSRVTVNRLWLQCFGEGLVETVGDFGSQGSLPSHPELLDWLARYFVDSGWNTKQLLRLIVTSATYRQSSVPTTEKLQRDPTNRLLARGPRFRLSAEMLRDQSLAVSGLLVPKIGGPPVRPPQPPGIWEAVSYNGELSYEPDRGEGRWRRSLYSYWKRTAPPPSIQAFDSPTRETCTLRRPRTNTPLQALALLNDETQVEAARVLAASVLQRNGLPASRLEVLFARATGRGPSESERATLERLLRLQLRRFAEHPSLARELNGIGEAAHGHDLAVDELAAWTLVAQTVLNLDEVITRR